jgi:hypothetical protein
VVSAGGGTEEERAVFPHSAQEAGNLHCFLQLRYLLHEMLTA